MQRRNVFALLLIKRTYIRVMYTAYICIHTLLFRCSGFMTNNIVVVAAVVVAVAVFVSSAVTLCVGILVHGSANKNSAITFWAYTSHNLFSEFYVDFLNRRKHVFMLLNRSSFFGGYRACTYFYVYIIHGATLNKPYTHAHTHIYTYTKCQPLPLNNSTWKWSHIAHKYFMRKLRTPSQ